MKKRGIIKDIIKLNLEPIVNYDCSYDSMDFDDKILYTVILDSNSPNYIDDEQKFYLVFHYLREILPVKMYSIDCRIGCFRFSVIL